MIKSIYNGMEVTPIYLNEDGIIDFSLKEGVELLDLEGLEELVEIGSLDPRSLKLVHLNEGIFQWKDIKEELAEVNGIGQLTDLELIMLEIDNHSKGRYIKVA